MPNDGWFDPANVVPGEDKRVLGWWRTTGAPAGEAWVCMFSEEPFEDSEGPGPYWAVTWPDGHLAACDRPPTRWRYIHIPTMGG